jgi:phage gp16-like protein
MSKPFKPLRQRLLAKVHIAKKEMKLSDDDYAVIVESVSRPGKTSSAQLNLQQLEALIERFKELGWQSKKPKKLSPKSRDKAEFEKNQKDKIRALWITAGQVGAIADNSESALQGFVKRMTDIDRIDWVVEVRHFNILIEGLKAMIKRKGHDPDDY